MWPTSIAAIERSFIWMLYIYVTIKMSTSQNVNKSKCQQPLHSSHMRPAWYRSILSFINGFYNVLVYCNVFYTLFLPCQLLNICMCMLAILAIGQGHLRCCQPPTKLLKQIKFTTRITYLILLLRKLSGSMFGQGQLLKTNLPFLSGSGVFLS